MIIKIFICFQWGVALNSNDTILSPSSKHLLDRLNKQAIYLIKINDIFEQLRHLARHAFLKNCSTYLDLIKI